MVDQAQTAIGHYEIRANRETHQERTGLQIKQDAIAADVKIKTTYVLEEERPDGNIRIGDEQVVTVHSGLKFIAHPGGSDS